MSEGSPERIAIITGGAGHLGRHVVARFLRDGMEVHVPIFVEEERSELLGFLGGNPPALRLHGDLDLSVPGGADRLIKDVGSSRPDGPQVLLNLAGGFTRGPVEDTDFATWERMWAINATTAFLCCHAVFAGMKARGWGRIVNVSAFPALERGKAGLSAYGAAKAAVLSLTHTLSKEGVAHGITVNAVLPSIIDTPDNRAAMPEADRSRWLPPASVAEVLWFLSSDAAHVVNGAAIPLTLG